MKLFDFQKKYIEKVKPNWIYDCDTGTGKTIMALFHHKRFFPEKNVLIVAPAAKIQEKSWQRTIDEHFSDIVSETDIKRDNICEICEICVGFKATVPPDIRR